VMHSSFLLNSPVVARIYGTKGKILLEDRWFCPGKVTLINAEGKVETFEFEVENNGYQYEAAEVASCILAGKTQSDSWSLNDSLKLVQVMDSIRKECGIVYPEHDL